jgi:alanine racemase
MPEHLKVWIDISSAAIKHNIDAIRALLPTTTQLWAVVKSNAYGHGIFTFSPVAQDYGVDGFCVDSVFEGSTLRSKGITKPILALGPTLESLYAQAAAHNIAITVSTHEALTQVEKLPHNARPSIHLKVDTGMHRQGFLMPELKTALAYCSEHKLPVTGLYSHLAASKNPDDLSYNKKQYALFAEAAAMARAFGFANLITHLAGTPGLLVGGHDYAFDAVRVGNGLYGIFPSPKLEAAFGKQLSLKPVLSMHARISEVKKIPAGEFIGYDCTVQLKRETLLAVVPIGYWHGIPRALSASGHILINGKKAPILGMVSMDLITIDATGTDAKIGDRITLIGTQGAQTIGIHEVAAAAGTSAQEIITRLNPLIERIVS